jgi:hypothetical protein
MSNSDDFTGEGGQEAPQDPLIDAWDRVDRLRRGVPYPTPAEDRDGTTGAGVASLVGLYLPDQGEAKVPEEVHPLQEVHPLLQPAESPVSHRAPLKNLGSTEDRLIEVIASRTEALLLLRLRQFLTGQLETWVRDAVRSELMRVTAGEATGGEATENTSSDTQASGEVIVIPPAGE